MALTPSNMLPLGTKAPDFKLLDTLSNKTLSLADIKGRKGTMIMFICNHCPFVIHVREQLVKVANDYLTQGIGFAAISSNDVEKYPEDGPDKMQQLGKQLNFSFPYLYDATQEVAKAYQAACTPDLYVFDSHLKCVYRGQLDESRPGNNNIPVTGKDIRAALDKVVKSKPVSDIQKPSVGCNIKWK